MTQGIEAVTLNSLSLALDAAVLRHQVTTYNIANAGVDGFAPMRVKFSQSMEDARRQLNEGRRLDNAHIVAWAGEPTTFESAIQGGLPGKVQLDAEVAQMAQNAVHYQALLKGLNKHMAVLASAISEGKR